MTPRQSGIKFVVLIQGKTISENSTRFMSTLTGLQRVQFGMEGQESTSSTQEAEKTKPSCQPIHHKLQS